jgi:uroporphyrin-III C-methyltransferase
VSALFKHIGKVILAGAGCGDPELITIKAVKYLQQATVILTDRLVSKEIIATYANASAQIIYVGKQHNAGASVPQKTINELLVEYAMQGNLVVRLKGGDIAFFSNVLDELQTLVAQDIPYEIIPGISAASGASAYAGIPLTARGYATSVRFVTCYKIDELGESYWKELANTDDTLVFYMSSNALQTVVTNLVKQNIALEKLLAIIEQATTPLQKVTISSLYHYEEDIAGKFFASPTLVIIGKVVALHNRFAWQENNEIQDELYFKPIV